MKNNKFVICIIFFVLLLSSCSNKNQEENLKYSSGEYQTFSGMLNECKGTTVVIGISEYEGSFDNAKIAICVIDSTNTAYSCRIGGTLGLNIGDTVKYNKR